jgi:hypothetical protein
VKTNSNKPVTFSLPDDPMPEPDDAMPEETN